MGEVRARGKISKDTKQVRGCSSMQSYRGKKRAFEGVEEDGGCW